MLSSDLFTVLTAGLFGREDVRVEWKSQFVRLPDHLSQQIERFWEERILASEKKDFVYDGLLCRLERWRHENHSLALHLRLTTYKHLLFSNAQTQRASTEFGADLLANALGISVVLVTADQKTLLIRRSETVGECPAKLDVIGGHIHPTEHAVDGTPDPFLAIQEEIREETGLAPAQLVELRCLGLIETEDTHKPELIFQARTEPDAAELLQSVRTTRSSEIAEALAIPVSRLGDFVQQNIRDFSPSALAALHLHTESGLLT